MTSEYAVDGSGLQKQTEIDIEAVRGRLDCFYEEMIGLPGAELDTALLRLASLSAWGHSMRGRLTRTRSRAGLSFVSLEMDPFVAAVAEQARTLERVNNIRRAARPHG